MALRADAVAPGCIQLGGGDDFGQSLAIARCQLRHVVLARPMAPLAAHAAFEKRRRLKPVFGVRDRLQPAGMALQTLDPYRPREIDRRMLLITGRIVPLPGGGIVRDWSLK